MAAKKKGLGRGLDVMIPDNSPSVPSGDEKAKALGAAVKVDISKVEPNRSQPRKTFNEESLEELSESIKVHGVLFPILVQDRGDHYEIIAGERRWRASMKAGLSQVPVIITDRSEQEIVEISLIENIHREDLNAVEEAMAYKRLMTEFSMNQEKVAERVGKNRSTVANSLRLLNLEQEIQYMLIDGSISAGHARALLTIEDPDKRLFIARKIVEDHLSVRDREKLVKNPDKLLKKKAKVPTPDVRDLIYRDMEQNLREKLSAKVSIAARNDGRGKIEIEFFSRDELDGLIELLLSVRREG